MSEVKEHTVSILSDIDGERFAVEAIIRTPEDARELLGALREAWDVYFEPEGRS